MDHQQALKEKGVSVRTDTIEQFRGKRLELIDPQRAGGIVRQPEQIHSEKMTEISSEEPA